MAYDFDRLTVLIVDDCHNMRELLRILLNAYGFTDIHAAKNGKAGLKALSKIEPDFIICDYNMAPMNGIEFIQAVRKKRGSRNRYVPIIMVTGHTEMSKILAARQAGATEFLAKPVSPKSLYDRIEMVIERPRDFVETGTFFGPDRRRSTLDEWAGEDKRRVTEDKRRVTYVD